jgi:hypothetical protein
VALREPHAAPGSALIVALACFLVGASAGCATYSDRVAEAHQRVDAGDLDGAIDEMNSVLRVGSREDLPADWNADRPLAVLERGALLQAVEVYGLSSRDLSAGEMEIEMLDLRLDTVGQIGSFIYSDSARNYHMSPTERLALNAVNMLNFLALNEWSAAAVEARRFTVMRNYLKTLGLEDQASFGAYLAGVTFERLGEGDRALRFYEEAMQQGTLESLRGPVARLARRNSYRGPRIRELLANTPPTADEAPSEIVTVVALGRVPRRAPKRIPIGLAIGAAGTFITGNPEILARSATAVVVYPELVDSSSRANAANVTVDGRPAPVERLSSLGDDIRREYDEIRPRIIGAAITRMIARAVAAEGMRAAGQQASPAVGLLAALATGATLVALDRPDTRSWSMLADQVLVSRQVVEPGRHEVRVRVTGSGLDSTRTFTLTLPPGSTAVLVVTEPQ